MNKTITIPALILAVVGFAVLGGSAFAQQKQSARCTLTHKTSVNVEGPCIVLEEGSIVEVQGTAEENGQTYIAAIDNGKATGLLIGAGTFTLADGELAENEMQKVVWPNGYVLTVELE